MLFRRNQTLWATAKRSEVTQIESHDMVFGIGPGGTGKTYLAVAMAVSALLTKQVKTHGNCSYGCVGNPENLSTNTLGSPLLSVLTGAV